MNEKIQFVKKIFLLKRDKNKNNDIKILKSHINK